MTVGPAPPLDDRVTATLPPLPLPHEFCTEGGQAPGLAASEPRTPDKAQQQQQQQQQGLVLGCCRECIPVH